MDILTNPDFRNSIYDGMFANMFATLTGGVFLTGFALHLGMDDLMVGLLGAMPFLVTVFQLPASYLIQKAGRRKKIASWSAAGARLMWLPIAIISLLPANAGPLPLITVFGLLFISYALVTISYVSWLSWISDLVPEDTRGRFFGTRNMLSGATATVSLLCFGKLVDTFNRPLFGGAPLGFALTFMSAIALGMMSLFFLNRVSEPPQARTDVSVTFLADLGLPLKERRFRRFLVFVLCWTFSVYFASPFFTLYFLRDLRFTYSFVATLGTLSAFADMLGMHVWGRISDRVKNRAVIQFASWVAVFLPMAWVVVEPESLVVPIILHILGGGFWAGINLCMNNLLLCISSQTNRPPFLSFYNVVAGLGATAGPVCSGVLLKVMGHGDLGFLPRYFMPLHIVFIMSTLFRLLSLQLFRKVQEPEAFTVGQMIRVLRGIRGLNATNGFNHPLHPYVEVGRVKENGQDGMRKKF